MILAILFGTLAVTLWVVRRLWWTRRIDRWMLTYIAQGQKRAAPNSDDEVHVLLCVADHFEPCLGGASDDLARQRVHRWLRQYPRLFGEMRDSDGRPPQHSFFVPLEEYVPAHLDSIARLCRWGFGEVEIHLHHDHDTADSLRTKLLGFKELLAERHNLLSRHRATGELAYGFIHGNWALDNARPDGRWCGVNNELEVLRQTGCFADFTMPSAPAAAQTRKINSIYYAVDDPVRPFSHDWGTDVGDGPAPDNGLMLIQGPLMLDWARRKWGVLPRIENGCIQVTQPPDMERLRLWQNARVQVPARPDWFFVKLHTHGAWEPNQDVLLGESMVRFHQNLAALAAFNRRFHYHYVTAREMYNLARAAESGWQGSVADARDFELVANFTPSNRSLPQTVRGPASAIALEEARRAARATRQRILIPDRSKSTGSRV